MSASEDYVALVRGILRHTHDMALDEREADYVARCEVAEISPHVVADVIAMHTRARLKIRQSHTSNV